MALEELYRPIEAELRRVQAMAAQCWDEALALIHGPSAALPKSSGKLLRPALCLLSAGAAGASDMSPFVGVSIAFELLHMAALTHDDIIDKANFRRGSISLNALWDDRTAVLSGDYLVSRATTLLAGTNSCALIANTFQAIQYMTEGELASFGRNADRFAQADCIRLAEQKTAIFFAATCTAPTYIVSGAFRDAFHEYGLALGIAFQLTDDLLDITQDQATLGKPSCGDIAQGKKTLPILFMREAMNGKDRERLNQMIGRPVSNRDRRWAAELVEVSRARARTEAVAREYAQKARAALAPLSAGAYKDSMLGLAEFVVARDS